MLKKREAGDPKNTPVQSLERAFAILEAVAERPDGARLADLSKIVGLHNSTVFHLVKTMQILGYLRQDDDTKRYHVGRKAFSLAAGAQDEVELVNLSLPLLQELADSCEETSHLAILSGHSAVTIARAEGSTTLRLAERIGAQRPAYCTALGKVLLAALRPDELDAYLEAQPLEPLTPKTLTERDVLLRNLDQIRETGVAFDDGEYDADLRCLAAPVRNFTGKVVAAIGVSGPAWRVSLPQIPRFTDQVTRIARAISAELGHR